MGLLDSLIPGWRRLRVNGTAASPARAGVNIVAAGATLTDDAVNGLSVVALVGGGSGAPLATVVFADAATAAPSGAQDGSIGAPFDDIPSANTALAAQLSRAIWVAPGLYLDTLTLNTASAFLTIDGHGGFYVMNDATVTDGTLTLRGCSFAGTLTIAASKSALLYDCAMNDATAATAGTGSLSLYRCNITSPALALGNLLLAEDTLFTGVSGITCSLSTAVTFRRCTFSGATVVTFSGSAGTLQLDEATMYSWILNGCSVVNGTVLYPGKTTTVTGTTHTVVVGNVGCTLLCTNAAGCTITVPQAATLPVLPGAQSFVKAIGTLGQVTWAGSGSMTVESAATLKSRAAKSMSAVEWTADNTTYLTGDLEL